MALASLGIIVKSDQVEHARVRLGNFRREGENAARAADRLKSRFETTNTAAGNLNRTLRLITGGFVGFAAIRGAASRIIEFEQGLIAASSAANLVGDEVTQLRDDVLELGRVLPLTTSRILEMEHAVAALGIKGVENMRIFTEAAAKLTATSELGGENAVLALGRMLAATGEGAQKAAELSAAITNLGIQAAAQADEIATIALRVTQATAAFEVSSTQAVALGTAMRSIGIVAELGASSIGRTLKRMETAVAKGGLQLEFFATISGKAAEDFKKSFGEDQLATLVDFLAGLRKLREEGVASSIALAAVGIEGIRDFQVLEPLAKNVKLLQEYLAQAADSAENLVAQQRLVEARAGTLQGQLQRLSNLYTAFLVKQDGVSKSLSNFLKFAIDTVAILADMDGAWQKGSEKARTFADLLDRIGRAFKDVAVGAADFAIKMYNIVVGISGLGDKIGTVDELLGKLGRAFSATAAVMVTAFQGMETAILGLLKLIGELAQMVDEKLHPEAYDLKTQMKVAEASRFQEKISKLPYADALRAFNEEIAAGIQELEEQRQRLVKQYMTADFPLPKAVAEKAAAQALREDERRLKAVQDAREAFIRGQKFDLADAFQPDESRFTRNLRTLDDRVGSAFDKSIEETRKKFEKLIYEDLPRIVAGQSPLEAERLKLKVAVADPTPEQLLKAKAAFQQAGVIPSPAEPGGAPIGRLLPPGVMDWEEYLRQAEKIPYRKRIAEIMAETAALKKLDLEKELDLELEKLRVKALEAKQPLDDKQVANFRRLYRLFQEARGAAQADEIFRTRTDSIRAQTETLGMTNDEMERYVELQGIVDDFRRQGLSVDKTKLAALDRELATLQRLTQLRETFRQIGEAAGKAFDDIITGARTAKEALLDLLQEVSRLVVHQLVTRHIVDFITSTLGGLLTPGKMSPGLRNYLSGTETPPAGAQHSQLAQGGAMRTIAAANGIIDRLVHIPMSDGRYVRAGEAGPEAAIAPLARTPEGRLGVEIVADRRRQKETVVNLNVYVSGKTTDPDGFRRASGQIAERVRRSITGR